MIVAKAVKMANMMHIPVLGFVENYSYLQCPDCGKKINVFGKSHLDEIAAQFELPVLARLPIDTAVAELEDSVRRRCALVGANNPTANFLMSRIQPFNCFQQAAPKFDP